MWTKIASSTSLTLIAFTYYFMTKKEEKSAFIKDLSNDFTDYENVNLRKNLIYSTRKKTGYKN